MSNLPESEMTARVELCDMLLYATVPPGITKPMSQCMNPKPCPLHPPQQSETTFEQWWSGYRKERSVATAGVYARGNAEAGWNAHATLRSRLSAEEVERIADRLHALLCCEKTDYAARPTVIAAITDALAKRPGRAGESKS